MTELLEDQPDHNPTESELTSYLGEKKRNPDTNPLVYWRDSPWPYLKKMARDYLAIMPTTATIERIFSVAGNIANPRHRNRISKARINQLVCLYNWETLPIAEDEDEDVSDDSNDDFEIPQEGQNTSQYESD
jgi:hAT family C-terminal dimerisation region